MDVDAETMELIITSLIYGVVSVSALSETAVIKLAKFIDQTNPRLKELLTDSRFVDDLADSDESEEAVDKVIDEADKLFDTVGLQCKGWSVSGRDPHPDVTHDGVSVDVGGQSWFPKIDSLVVKIPANEILNKSNNCMIWPSIQYWICI